MWHPAAPLQDTSLDPRPVAGSLLSLSAGIALSHRKSSHTKCPVPHSVTDPCWEEGVIGSKARVSSLYLLMLKEPSQLQGDLLNQLSSLWQMLDSSAPPSYSFLSYPTGVDLQGAPQFTCLMQTFISDSVFSGKQN